MPITVQIGDSGDEVEFPDNTHPDVIQSALQKHYAPPADPTVSNFINQPDIPPPRSLDPSTFGVPPEDLESNLSFGAKFLPRMLGAGLEGAGNISRALATDAYQLSPAGVGTSLLFHTPPEPLNTPVSLKDEPLPVDVGLSELSKSNPNVAILGKIGQGAAASLPLIPAGAGLPAWAGRLIAAGFTADMIAKAPEQARQLGDELGKNPQDQDPDKITSLKSSLAQTALFAPAAGAHAVGEIPITKGDYGRLLEREMRNSPLNPSSLDITSPIPIKQFGIPTPNFEPFLQPGVSELADAALNDRTRGIIDPTREPALQTLRRAIEPPQIEPVTIATAERPGGGEARFGRTSFQRPAEAPLTPETQAARQADLTPQSITQPSTVIPDTVEESQPGTPLRSVVDVLQDKLRKRDFVAAVDALQKLPVDAQVKAVNEAIGVGKKKVPLSAAERTIFNETWDKVYQESLGKKGEPNAPQTGNEQGGNLGQHPGNDEGGTPPTTSSGGVPTERGPIAPTAGGGNAQTPQVTLDTIANQTGREFFDTSQKWSQESMSGHGISPQIQAELTAKANPDLKAWESAAEKAGKEADAVRDAAKADPSLIADPEFQKRWSGAAQKAQFFNEGRDVLNGKKQYSPRTLELSPNPVDKTLSNEAKSAPVTEAPAKEISPSPNSKEGILANGIKNIEALQAAIRKGPQSGQLLMGVPRAILDTALESARLALLAGNTIAEAVEAAMGHIRRNIKKADYDEAKVRQQISDEIGRIKTPEVESKANATPVSRTPSAGEKVPSGSGERGGKNSISPTKSGALDDIYKIFEPKPKEPSSVKTKAINIIESLRTGLSSKFRPLNKLAEDIAKAYGRSSSKDVAGIFEQLKGSQGKGEAEIYRFDRDVSSLVKGDEKDFNAYLFLRRGIDRLEQDAKDIGRAQEGEQVKTLNRRRISDYTLNQLRPKLAALEQKLGPEKLAKFQKAAQGYQDYLDDALRLQVESGRMSPEVYNAIKEGNQFYAPFKVMKYLEETSKPEGTSRQIDTKAEFTKAMQGIDDGDFRLGDMLGAARQNILLSRILADKNTAMRHLGELAAFDTEGTFIKKLKPNEHPASDMEAVNVLEHGKPEQYAVNKDVSEAIKSLGGTGGGILLRFLGKAAIPFRAGATALNLPFQVSNLLADVPRQALVSKYGLRGFQDLIHYPLDFVHSLYSSIAGDVFGHQTKLFQDFLDSGVAGTTVQEYLTPEALKFQEPTAISKSAKLAKTVLNVVPDFAAAIEQTSKILGVKRALRFENAQSGAQLAHQIPEAITELRRFSGSPDFGRQGKFIEQARLNLLYMFLNARIQGAIADVGRLTGRDGGKVAASTWAKMGAAVGIPTAYLYYLNNSPQYKDDYDKRSTQEKQNYFLIPKDSFITTEDGQKVRDYWRIPKRESVKWFANLTESALDFAHKRDPKSAVDFGNQMLQEISPVNIQGNTAQEKLESTASGLNPLIKAPLELATGRDLYRHRDLMSDQLKKASPEQQYTDRTAEAFKKLAVLMPDVAPEFLRSPIILENLTRNLTAGLVTQFLPRKPVEGRSNLENTALLQRFQALPYEDNAAFKDTITNLERDAADEQLARHRAAQKLMEDNKGKPLDQIAAKADGDVKLIKHVADLYIAQQNGATFQDRQLLALPAKQRAMFIANALHGLTPEKKQEAIQNFARKRILTEAVVQELPEVMK